VTGLWVDAVARRLKYGNKPTIVGGIRFASQAEARRWGELRLLEKAGEIRRLRQQEKFDLRIFPNVADADYSVLIGRYYADFAYAVMRGGKEHQIAEDVKGVMTPVFRLKAKLFAALYPAWELRIVKA